MKPFNGTHDELSVIAMKWLKRSVGNKGPGCQLAMTEIGGKWNGERADAWGFRNGYPHGSTLVEAKVSRADFLSDGKKPHRNGEVLGMGTYRYYICPWGMIQPEEIPELWGLLWVNNLGHVKVIAGHALGGRCEHWQHECNHEVEIDALATALASTGDPAENIANRRLRYRLQDQVRILEGELEKARLRISNLEHQMEQAEEKGFTYDRWHGFKNLKPRRKHADKT